MHHAPYRYQHLIKIHSYLRKELGQHKIFDKRTVTTTQPKRPAKAPSKVFLGLMSVNGVFPNAWNIKKVILNKNSK
jgi:hypothetical protein